ncbi:unnamed protein product [Linum trigynum]|uniref:Uncharacterized protein n=1 Tax=Linum trigynum TaxID=586398 RepID=A0AAV2EGR2_9ROSI
METNGLVNRLSHLCINDPLILNGQLLLLLEQHISHPFTSMANEVLSAGSAIIDKIRDNITYVKASGIHGEAPHLFLDDDQCQWNTTYQMLASALDQKEVFSHLHTVIPEYRDAPTVEDWRQVEIICALLRSLSDAMGKLVASAPCPPTTSTMFHEALMVHLHIVSRAAAAAATNGDHQFLGSFIEPMQEKMDKYWKECGLVLSIAVVMDPRFKMQFVKFSSPKIFGDEASHYVKMVDDGLHELFSECLALSPPPFPAPNADRVGEHNQLVGSISGYGLADFDVYIMEATTSKQFKSELDQYLDEDLQGRSSNFDAVEWWKQESVRLRYPTLSKMARDILSIPVFTA